MTDKVLISSDVTSLFTNIPMFEEIDIGINLNFEGSPDIKYTKHGLQKPFRIATSETHVILMAAFLVRLMVCQWVSHCCLF